MNHQETQAGEIQRKLQISIDNKFSKNQDKHVRRIQEKKAPFLKERKKKQD